MERCKPGRTCFANGGSPDRLGGASTAETDGLVACRPAWRQMPLRGYPTPVISQATESMNGVTLPQPTGDRDQLSLPPRPCERNLPRVQQPCDRPAALEVTFDLRHDARGLLRVAALCIIINRNF
jgi:hypothetical protein